MNCLSYCFTLIFCHFYFVNAFASQTHYKLYCLYTPLYETLFNDYFLPSLKDDFELIVEVHPQECPSGNFRQEGWDKTMLRKLELLEKAILENWDQVFFYSDIDIIFLKPILEKSLDHLDNKDFVVQQGWPKNKICAGFFVMRGSNKTLQFIQKAHEILENNLSKSDQDALQMVLDGYKKEEIDWKLLPSEQYPNGGRILQDQENLYLKTSKINLTDSMILFHGNYTIGLENKQHLLKRVQEEFNP